VQFKPEGNDEVTTTGLIQPDGSFTLTSAVDSQPVSEAQEVRYTGTILPPLSNRGDWSDPLQRTR
jgi:hypothetical protein